MVAASINLDSTWVAMLAVVVTTVVVIVWMRAAACPMRITELWIYPIKSCGGIQVSQQEHASSVSTTPS